ncbi:LamG-like jellyroll fold domain-containing protein [Ramlibacter humi]|uniref:RHS repeat protein n=1 Tax=Ramlibacter humi TaxID=2530451 RepID=A0A4Z0BG47_9BURK|nr:LamG-like jellyroll fold domain-containing protein [Ramlibacter humi]TFY97104.1 hypothetical protein EZ216_19790 [Ramlibacter humi]
MEVSESIKNYAGEVRRVRRVFGRLIFVLSLLTILSVGRAAIAAATDCEGMSVDGRAQCIAPTYPPVGYAVCDIGPPYGYKIAAWNACSAELAVTNPIWSEADVVAYANCFDRRISGAGGVTGSVPWLPPGTPYNDGSCVGGTVREVDGHPIWGVGNKTGGSGTVFAFTRGSSPTCPAGYTGVGMNLRGVSELVRCKPVTPCAPGEVQSATNPNTCLSVAEVPETEKVCATCPGGKHAGLGNPIYPLTGAKRQSVDTGLSVGGIPLTLTYDTTPALNGLPARRLRSFGRLWSSTFHRSIEVVSGGRVLSAHRGDGRVTVFVLKNGVYTADGDEVDKVVPISGGYVITDARTQRVETYNSQGLLTKMEGAGLSLSFLYGPAPNGLGSGYLLSVSDLSGRSISFRYEMEAGSEPESSTRGRIAEVSDPTGRRVAFGYDSASNLTAATWPGGKTIQFLYELASVPWAMTGRINETGVRDRTWSYDAAGFATATSQPLGVESYSVAYGSAPSYVVQSTEDLATGVLYRRYTASAPSGLSVTGPNSQTSAWTSASVLGAPLLTGTSQPAGSGAGASASSTLFDAVGNVVQRDDVSGARTCYAYDAANREITRVEGLGTSASCAAVLPAGAALPAGARRVTTAWHPDWRLPSSEVQSLRKRGFVYQGQPDPLNGNSPASCTTAPALANGRPVPVLCRRFEQALLANGTVDASVPAFVESRAYDSRGRLVTSSTAAGTTTYTYYPTSLYALSDSDPAMANTVLLVHGEGALSDSSIRQQPLTPVGNAAVIYSDARFGYSSLYFDGSNNSYVSVPTSDFNFGTGDFTIEGWFRLAAATGNYRYLFNITWGSGSNMLVRFGDGGFGLRLQYAVDGNTHPGVYGSAETQNSLAGTWHHFALTRQAGAVRGFLDGKLLTLRNNIYGGPPVTSFMDSRDISNVSSVVISGGASFYGHIDDFRVTKGVARYTADFSPPTQAFPDPELVYAAGDLTSVTNAAGHVTTFTKYDRAGRVLQMTDPRGITTDYSYSPTGKVTRMVVAAAGVDARVTTYVYNDLDLLVSVQEPDGTSTSFAYDEAQRLVSVADSRGNRVRYSLDASGNRVLEEVLDPQGTVRRAVSRSFDALDRVQQIRFGSN